jgi:hypothetical protein
MAQDFGGAGADVIRFTNLSLLHDSGNSSDSGLDDTLGPLFLGRGTLSALSVGRIVPRESQAARRLDLGTTLDPSGAVLAVIRGRRVGSTGISPAGSLPATYARPGCC